MSHLHNTYSTQLLSMSIALCFWAPSITTAQEPPPPPPPPLGDIFNDIFNDADTDDTTTPKPTTRNSTKNQIYNKPSNTVTTPDNSTAPNIIVPLPTTRNSTKNQIYIKPSNTLITPDSSTAPKPTTRNSTKNQIYNKPSNTVTTPDSSIAPDTTNTTVTPPAPTEGDNNTLTGNPGSLDTNTEPDTTTTNSPEVAVTPGSQTQNSGAVDTLSFSYTPLTNIPSVSENDTTSITSYINRLFVLAVVIGAILAVVKITIGGFKYMMSDVITDKSAAKKDITGALLGLGIVLSTFLVLYTIYPNLVNTNILGGGRALQTGGGTLESQAQQPADGGAACNKNDPDFNECMGKTCPLGVTSEGACATDCDVTNATCMAARCGAAGVYPDGRDANNIPKWKCGGGDENTDYEEDSSEELDTADDNNSDNTATNLPGLCPIDGVGNASAARDVCSNECERVGGVPQTVGTHPNRAIACNPS